MTNRPFLLLCCILFLLLLSACSVIPRKVVPQAKVKAYQFLEQARREELKANYTDAFSIYTEAEGNAILCNDFNAQLVALQGKARITYIRNDKTEYGKILTSMQNLVADINPGYSYRVLQIQFWEYFRTGQYERILQTVYNENKLPFYVKVEILSYKVQAQAYLKQTNQADNAKLDTAVKKYYHKFKSSKNLQAEMISNAWYALAFSDAGNGMYAKALIRLRKAMVMDRDYDLYVQLADDYALAGMCEYKLGNLPKAKAYYTIALQIYTKLSLADEMAKVQTHISEIPAENK